MIPSPEAREMARITQARLDKYAMTLEEVRYAMRQTVAAQDYPTLGAVSEWADAIDSAIAARKVPEWQPIETAPREGRFLVYGEFAGEIGGPQGFSCVGVADEYTERSDYPGFHWRAANTDAYAGWWKPTRWMPLPAAPKVTP